MAHPWHHAERSARQFGGEPEDYVEIHSWFDESKAHLPDLRHRALRHHSEGIFLCERLFGVTVENSDGKHVPVRLIGEQHVKDDLGFIPTVQDWLSNLKVERWMRRTPFKPSTEGLDTRTANEAAATNDATSSDPVPEPRQPGADTTACEETAG